MKRILTIVLAALMLAGCGNVPLTGRRQILLVSDQEVYQAGLVQYKEYLSTATLSSNAEMTRLVKKVGQDLAAATEKYLKANGYASEINNFSWEFNLVKDPQVNAFCMPGGKIVVYEGLLTVAQNADELAVVLGHEIAHAVAKHSNERMSQQILSQYGMAILSEALSEKSAAIQSTAVTVFGLGAQYGLILPYSRKHEYEADYMGLVFMEIAGYDSQSAIGFWTKMASGGQSAPEFMSTHPSDSKRITQIRQRIPEAQAVAASMK